MNINTAWDTVVLNITPRKNFASTEVELKTAAELLQDSGLAQIVEEWFFETLKADLRENVSTQFWSNFENANIDIAEENIPSAFRDLYEHLQSYEACILRLQYLKDCFVNVRSPVKSLGGHVQMLLKALVFFRSTKVFQDAVQQFYTRAFQVFLPSETEEEEDDDTCNRCHDYAVEKSLCTCADIMCTFHTLNRQLHELGLLEWISGDAVTNVIHQKIRLHVDFLCRGNFETNYLEKLDKWLEVKVLGWLRILYDSQGDNRTSSEAALHIQSQKDRLYHFMYETYASIRIDELFNIIVEFPESEPAIQDLKSCLEKTDLRPHLVSSLKTALETRLLHPGVNTADILTAYISAIRALRMLDPSGVLLELVCDPVRKYLRFRDDTVRCIVSSLTDDGSNELSDELIKAQPLKMDDSCHSDDDTEDWQTWMPDPVDADPAKTSPSRRSSDIISMLVNIYGSKELFVNEYRTLLADRILSQFNYDTEKEIRYLELLKLRFGETQLHYCEVMLKDVADSKRINQHIVEQRKKQEPNPQEIPVNSMILSAQFWPSFREETLDLPPTLQEALDSYTKSFEALKGNRTLSWKPHLGLVDIEIELKDKTLSFNVSPVHATIMMHFQEKVKWTIEELGSSMNMSTAAVRRKITYWQSQGLLREEPTDTFHLMEEQKNKGHEVIIMEDEDTESAMASQEDQREEELQVFWSYIVGMLTNLESLPLERIHSILKMFAMQGPSSTGEVSLQELKAFLDKKVKEQKLIYAGGVYRIPSSLPKPGS